MNRVFIDMDGVIVDFEQYMEDHNLTPFETKNKNGAYREMEPISGALEAVREVIDMGFEVWIATKPPSGASNANSYMEKVEWVYEHLPELGKRIIITHDKGLLGDRGDFLIDDRPHKANCEAFQGTFYHFENKDHWSTILFMLKSKVPN